MTILEVSSTGYTLSEGRQLRGGKWEHQEAPSLPAVGQGVVGRPLPLVAIQRYVVQSLTGAQFKQYEDGTWFAKTRHLRGPLAFGATEDDALTELADVILDWIVLKIEDGDRDFPVLPGTFDLNQI